MPSHIHTKTYQKRIRLDNTKSVEAVNALFAENITKRLKCRRKAKLKVKELPARTGPYLLDDSLNIEPNNTFDKLLKGKVYNKVKVANNVKLNSSESDTSKCNIQVSTSFHSPIMTRSRKKTSLEITDSLDHSKETTEELIKISTLSKPVTSSFSIEKENKGPNFSSLSYIKLPNIAENVVLNNNGEQSCGHIFSDTFRERQTIHSSTPCMEASFKKIVTDKISPIKLIEKSYDHIRQWDQQFPNLDGDSPKRKRKSSRISMQMKGSRRKLSTTIDEDLKGINRDWKLRCQPKVYLTPLTIPKKIKLTRKRIYDAILDFRGFDEKEQSSIHEKTSQFQIWLNEITPQKSVAVEGNDLSVTSSRESIVKEPSTNELCQTTPPRSASVEGNSLSIMPPKRSGLRQNEANELNKIIPPKPVTGEVSHLSVTPPRESVLRENETNELSKTAPPKSLTVEVNKISIMPSKQSVVKKKRKNSYITLRRRKVSYCEKPSKSPSQGGRKSESGKGSVIYLKDFDTFMQNYYGLEQGELDTHKTAENSFEIHDQLDEVISLSDDSLNPIEKIKREPRLSSEENLQSSVDNLNTTPPKSEAHASSDRSFDFLIPARKSNQKGTVSSKIIILSDITLGRESKILNLNDSLQNIFHDHSYNSPIRKVRQNTSNHSNMKKCLINDTPPPNDSYLSDIVESSAISDTGKENEIVNKKYDERMTRKFKEKSIKLKPGKAYRRSVSLLKRCSVLVDVHNSKLCEVDCVCLKCIFRAKLNPDLQRRCSSIVPALNQSRNNSLLENYARSYVREEDYIDHLDDSVKSLSLNTSSSNLLPKLPVVTAKDIVLRRCGQTDILPFKECYTRSALQHCRKIGEGVYGEVFLYQNPNGGTSVMKVIPIEGDLIVNGERQKKFEEIISEIVIAMELSNLRDNKKNTTTGFSEVQKVLCAQGTYPDQLLDLWELYDETKGSENDSPQMFPPNQTYIILELANGGQDLESYVFNNAQQIFSMFKQTACALAVAEQQLKFEHRDLHWGNILISTVDKRKTLRYRLDGRDIEIKTHGVEVAIIDFTLSRIEFDGVVIFNNLSLDHELFIAKGDYQFDIYRLMQKSNGDEWEHFEPYTNILWLDYVLDKAVSALRCKNTKTKVHREFLGKLNKIKDEILNFNSVVEFVNKTF